MVRTEPSILSLAARRQGIARYAALHLDCARSAEGGAYRFALEKQLPSEQSSASPRERNASKLLCDIRFDSFEFFGRDRPSLFFFDQVIEQEFAPASFAPISECFSRELALQLGSTIGGI